MKHYWILTVFLALSVFGATAQRVVIAEYPMSALNEKHFISIDTSDNILYYKIGAHPAGLHKTVELTIAQPHIIAFVSELQAALKQYQKYSKRVQKGDIADDRMIELNITQYEQSLFAKFSYAYLDREFITKPLFTKYYFNNKNGINTLVVTCIEDINAHTGQQEGAILTFSDEKEIGFFISCFNPKFVKTYVDAANKAHEDAANKANLRTR